MPADTRHSHGAFYKASAFKFTTLCLLCCCHRRGAATGELMGQPSLPTATAPQHHSRPSAVWRGFHNLFGCVTKKGYFLGWRRRDAGCAARCGLGSAVCDAPRTAQQRSVRPLSHRDGARGNGRCGGVPFSGSTSAGICVLCRSRSNEHARRMVASTAAGCGWC